MTDNGERRKRRGILLFALAGICLQALAVFVYLRIEDQRDPETPLGKFTYEALSGQTPLDAAVETRAGAVRELRALRGKTVLVHFWATWCAPCKQELPALLELGQELSREGDFELLAVTVDHDWAAVDTFFAGATPAAVHRDARGEAVEAFAVSALPDSFLLDAAGLPVLRFAGAKNWKSPEAERLLRSRLRTGTK